MKKSSSPFGTSIYKIADDKRRKDRPWRIAYYDENHKRRVVQGFTDFEATRAKASEIRRNVERKLAGLLTADVEHAATSINTHLEEFVASRRGRNRSENYVKQLESRIRRVLNGLKIGSTRELDPAVIEPFLNEHIPGDRTKNEHITSLKSFSRWLQRMRRTTNDPLAALERVEAKNVRHLHRRRSLTRQELLKLFDAAERRPLVEARMIRRGKHKGLPLAKLHPTIVAQLRQKGRDRRLAYFIAAMTGLRRSELLALQWGDVDLNAGVITLRAETTKSRRADLLPMLPEVVEALLTIRPSNASPEERVLSHLPTIRVMWADLALAGIPRVVTINRESRHIDFHALRKTYNSLLAESGIDPRIRQHLMRHADGRLTEGVYLDPRMLPVVQALKGMPPLGFVARSASEHDERHDERAPGSSSPKQSSSDANDEDAFLIDGWPSSLDELRQVIDMALLEYETKNPTSFDIGFSSQRAKGLEPSTFTLAT